MKAYQEQQRFQQSPTKKYQYYTGSERNSGVSTSNIDNHRNSIQQRIANLQAKISQKYNHLGDSNKNKVSVSQNIVPITKNYEKISKDYLPTSQHYVSVSDNNIVMSGSYSNANKLMNNNRHYQKSQNYMDKHDLSSQTIANKFMQSNQIYKNKGVSSASRSNNDNQNQMLRSSQNQRNLFSSAAKNSNQIFNLKTIKDKYEKIDLQKVSYQKVDDKRYKHTTLQNRHENKIQDNKDKKNQNIIKRGIQINNYQRKTIQTKIIQKQDHYLRKQQNIEKFNEDKLKSSNNYRKKYQTNEHFSFLPLTQQNIYFRSKFQQKQIASTQKTLPYYQQQFTHLNKTISSLRKQPQIYDNFIDQQNLKYKHIPQLALTDTLRGKSQSSQNAQLYQIMKTILLGQQKLQKQLQLIKNKEIQAKHSPNKFQQSYTKDSYRLPLRQKRDTNPKITQYSSTKLNIKTLNVSPLKNNKQKQNKSPINLKNANHKQNPKSQQSSAIKQRRCNSAAQSKNKAGKIGKIGKINKQQQFFQLYKQAQKQKHLSPLNSRVCISQQAISSVWDRIKCVIERSSLQDSESSKVYHENNRYINDHLVNSIQLQRRLKSDMVKKVYDMCENKCLFK